MSNIDTYLAKIMSAVYGEEVRGSIHDAIEECYTDTTTGKTTADTAAVAADAAATRANTAAAEAEEIADDMDGLVKVQNTQPSEAINKVWFDTTGNGEYTLPEVDDSTVSDENTWSSQKIRNEIDAGDADLKSALNAFDIAATASDVGKALKAKTVSNGKVTEYELGDAAVIDPTLSVSGEAADAKATGDAISSLQSAIIDLPKVSGWVEGKYYNTSGSSASVDIESPQNDANYETVVLPCNDYDYFVINSTGGENQRAWAFLDENYTIILNANPISNCVNEVIQANHGARYLIINKRITDKDCYIGRTISDEFAEQKELNDVLDGVVESIPYINKDVRFTNRYNGKYGYGTLNESGIIIKSVKNNNQTSVVTDFLEVAGNTNYYFSRLEKGTRRAIQISVICQYDSGKRFLSRQTVKSDITTLENCKYIRLALPIALEYILNRDFMVLVGNNYKYVPYTNKDMYVGSIKNEFYSSHRGENTKASTSSLKLYYSASADGHICFGTIAIKSEYEITRVDAKISDSNIRYFYEFTIGEWKRIAIVGKRKATGTPDLTIHVEFADNEDHPFQYKDALGFDETAVFGAGCELSAKSILLKLSDKSFEHEYFTLVTDCGVASPVSKIESPRIMMLGTTENSYIGFGNENEIIISSSPYSMWTGWNEIGTYGQTNKTTIPIYNKVHGTLETDGMFSAFPLWGCWSENASGSNSHHGGHVFHGWTTDRQHRLTMAVNIYRDDEAAIFNYVPKDKEEGQISGEGKFLRLRLGADNLSHGVLLDNVYVEGQGYYTRLQINGPLNITANAPAAANADGLKGDVRFDQNYVYFCVANNTWKRIPLESWT